MITQKLAARWLLAIFGVACFLSVAALPANVMLEHVAGSSVRIELPASLGSGVYIGGGLIITAAHVVVDAPRAVLGTDAAGNPVLGAPIVKIISDAGDVQDGEVLWVNRTYDIAAVRPSNQKRFTAASLACRDAIVGEEISAEGNPVGIQFITMYGHVAGVTREFAPNWKEAFVSSMTVISGMSGGATFDQFGQVLGITVGAMDPHGSANSANEGGLGFIVPSLTVCHLLGRS